MATTDSSVPADPSREEETPHGCYDGYHYLGWESEEEGELVEVYDKVRCRRCEREDG
jgi:hypothetical protein